MRNVMAALAALLVALPAAAQTQVVPYNGSNPVITGSVTTSGDVVIVPISGASWATVVWSVVGPAGSVGVNAEVSSDGGTNYTFAPYSKRLNLVTANPSITAFRTNNAIATGDVWETPLPANTTTFRIRCGGSGTVGNFSISGGTPYVSGMPLMAILYDISVTAGANNNTPTIDVAGWREVTTSIVVTTAATGAASLNIVDDAGVAIAIGTSASIAVGTFAFGWGDSGAFGTANPFTMVGGVTALPLDRRFNIAVAGATTSAVRIRVAARR